MRACKAVLLRVLAASLAGAAPCVLLALAPANCTAADVKPAPTIKDLDNQPVEIKNEPPPNVDAAKTMESYKRFLDLNAGDAALSSMWHVPAP